MSLIEIVASLIGITAFLMLCSWVIAEAVERAVDKYGFGFITWIDEASTRAYEKLEEKNG